MATVFWGYSRLHWDRHVWDVPPEVFVCTQDAQFLRRRVEKSNIAM